MKVNNLERAKELAEEYACLTAARDILSGEVFQVEVSGLGRHVTLPANLRHNILNVINCQRELVREEVETL